jgi:murein DD-endopeptidase MepM/ murein hydrolase activator NlpD
MIFSKSEFSTVLVVSKNGEETKSIKVPTKHLKSWKIYIGILCLIFLGLTTVIVILSRNLSEHNREKVLLSQKILQLEKKVPQAEDTLKAKTYIQSIEGKLKKINEYLTKRGIKGFSRNSVGGNNEGDVNLSPNEIYAFYDTQVKNILNSIAYTPIGYSAESPVMTSGFGYRSDPFRSGRAEFHAGLDFKGHKGDRVKSTADGEIIHASWFQGYGQCIRIKHKNGLETLYGHLSKILVHTGQKVNAGQLIGYMGSTGQSTGTHLHYEVRKSGKPINPVNYLRLN